MPKEQSIGSLAFGSFVYLDIHKSMRLSCVNVVFIKWRNVHPYPSWIAPGLQHNLSNRKMLGRPCSLLLCLDTGICSLCKAHLTSAVSDHVRNQFPAVLLCLSFPQLIVVSAWNSSWNSPGAIEIQVLQFGLVLAACTFEPPSHSPFASTAWSCIICIYLHISAYICRFWCPFENFLDFSFCLADCSFMIGLSVWPDQHIVPSCSIMFHLSSLHSASARSQISSPAFWASMTWAKRAKIAKPWNVTKQWSQLSQA